MSLVVHTCLFITRPHLSLPCLLVPLSLCMAASHAVSLSCLTPPCYVSTRLSLCHVIAVSMTYRFLSCLCLAPLLCLAPVVCLAPPVLVVPHSDQGIPGMPRSLSSCSQCGRRTSPSSFLSSSMSCCLSCDLCVCRAPACAYASPKHKSRR